MEIERQVYFILLFNFIYDDSMIVPAHLGGIDRLMKQPF